MNTKIISLGAMLLALGTVVVLTAAACGGGEDPEELSIQIRLPQDVLDPGTTTVKKGTTVTFRGADHPSNGNEDLHIDDHEHPEEGQQVGILEVRPR